MRLRWSAAELKALLRRWAAFIAVVAAVLGQFFATLIGWPALPLFWASEQNHLLGLAAVLLHALPGLLLCWGLREQLLPTHWLEPERALPLRRAEILRADLAVIALALLPLALLYLISIIAWRYADPAWMRGLWPAALINFTLSLLLSAVAAAALMQLRRRPHVGAAPLASQAPSGGRPLAAAMASHWALLLLPLWRGPARPVLHVLLMACIALAATLLAALCWPQQASWALAVYTLLSMGLSARLHAQARRCYAPLMLASQVLPLAPKFWPHRLLLLALAPAMLAWCALLALLLLGPWHLAPLATPLFFAYGLLAPTWPIMAAQGGSPESRAGRWLLSWAIWVALASEVLLSLPA